VLPAVPVAVSLLAETNVVVRGVPSNSTMAPFTKPLPFSVSVNDPSGIVDGFADASVGNGF
jgi:hypothetical protein